MPKSRSASLSAAAADVRRRTREAIVADIIRCTASGCRKTKIMYKASLNFKQLNGYVEFLCSHGFLHYEAASRTYRATSKGNAYVEKYDEYTKAKQSARLRGETIRNILGNRK
jgi:predicted transcriptional regulator